MDYQRWMRRHSINQLIIESFEPGNTWLVVRPNSKVYPYTQSISVPFRGKDIPWKAMVKSLRKHKERSLRGSRQ